MDYQISNMHESIFYHIHSIRSIPNSPIPSLSSFHPHIYYPSLTIAIIFSLLSPHKSWTNYRHSKNSVARNVLQLPRRSTDSINHYSNSSKYKLSSRYSKTFLLDTPLSYLIYNKRVSLNPFNLFSYFHLVSPHIMGTHYLPPLVPYHLRAPSNVTLNPLLFSRFLIIN